MKYLTSEILTLHWTYVRTGDIEIDDSPDSSSSFDDFGDFKAKLRADDEEPEEEEFVFDWDGCEVLSEIPATYKNGQTMSI